MLADLYSKVLLTVVALSLALIAVNPWVAPSKEPIRIISDSSGQIFHIVDLDRKLVRSYAWKDMKDGFRLVKTSVFGREGFVFDKEQVEKAGEELLSEHGRTADPSEAERGKNR